MSLKKDYTTIAECVQILKDTGLLRFLMQNKQEKIYLDNPNLLYASNAEVGKVPLPGVIRELFVISSLQNANYHVFFSKEGDIECNDVLFEIGGKSKTFEGYLIKDDILIGDPKTIPLYLFGFLA